MIGSGHCLSVNAENLTTIFVLSGIFCFCVYPVSSNYTVCKRFTEEPLHRLTAVPLSFQERLLSSVRIPQSGKLLPQLCGKGMPRQSGTVFNIVENHFGGRRRRFPQKIHQRGKLVENIFSQKIPVSGGLPVLIPKNQRFLSKTHCVSCGIL